MGTKNNLLGVSLVEKDNNGDALWTWTYPSIDEGMRELLLQKCCLSATSSSGDKDQALEIVPFSFGHFGRTWYYILTVDAGAAEALPEVTYASIILQAKDFHPEKYQQLCDILLKTYAATGNAAKLLELYLSVATRGGCQGPSGESFVVKSFDVRQAYAAASLKDVVRKFGIESIYLYTALLLKKRVVAFHSNLAVLQQFIRALPTLVWHRQNWNILYPHVHLADAELEDLTTTSSYLAGFTDSSVESHVNLYDVFVNIAGGTIDIAPHAKEAFGMGKIHKDIATLMVKCADDDEMGEQAMIKEVALKTKDLINNLKGLAEEDEELGRSVVTLDRLRERKLTPAMENFLFHLASAEGLVRF